MGHNHRPDELDRGVSRVRSVARAEFISVRIDDVEIAHDIRKRYIRTISTYGVSSAKPSGPNLRSRFGVRHPAMQNFQLAWLGLQVCGQPLSQPVQGLDALGQDDKAVGSVVDLPGEIG